MQFRPIATSPGKTWLSWCRPATTLHQPRDKKLTKFRASLCSSAPTPPSPHPLLTCQSHSLLACQSAQLHSLFQLVSKSISTQTQVAFPKFASGSKTNPGQPTTETSQSLSSPSRDVDPSNERTASAKPKGTVKARPTWELGLHARAIDVGFGQGICVKGQRARHPLLAQKTRTESLHQHEESVRWYTNKQLPTNIRPSRTNKPGNSRRRYHAEEEGNTGKKDWIGRGYRLARLGRNCDGAKTLLKAYNEAAAQNARWHPQNLR
jgi:hypothetical protein